MTITKYISADGTIAYMDSNKFLHREDGPALICNSGTQEYYFHGKHHRLDGPAIIQVFDSGSKSLHYFCHGKLHRLDGPARIFADGYTQWFYYGKYIPVKSQIEFERYLKLMAFI